MKISKNWLEEYIDLGGLETGDIAKVLTNIGLEVEGVEAIAGIDPKVVYGQIISAEQHPNADKLQVCRVDIGEEEPLQIVCGAPNARPELVVAVATVGSVLPGDFKIKKGKIRGEVSLGMLCAEEELGLSSASEGIMEITGTPQLGRSICEDYPTSDEVFELSVTPNRSDCLSVRGVARDLAAAYSKELVAQEPGSADEGPSGLELEVDETAGVGRFTLVKIEGVNGGAESPGWMQRRLLACGMRPIGLLVDISNYAMLDLGLPNHMYDASRIQSSGLGVRRMKEGDSFELTTLDGGRPQLRPDDLLIMDGNTPVGLAGVMGGASSEVSNTTKDILLEVAHFNPTAVRRTSKRLGFHTEASHRFERGIDIGAIRVASQKICQLVVRCHQELGLPEPKVAPVADYYPKPLNPRLIAFRASRVSSLLGLPELSKTACQEALRKLGLRIVDQKGDRTVVEVPTWRVDIEREVDLIEEVGRLIGLDTIPYSMPQMEIRPNPEHPMVSFIETLATIVASTGLTEVKTYPFCAASDYQKLGIKPASPMHPNVSLKNPLRAEQGLLQASLIPGLLESVISGRNHGVKGAKIFEISRTYRQKTGAGGPFEYLEQAPWHLSAKAQTETNRPIERHLVSGLVDQPFLTKTWDRAAETPADFFTIKAILCGICSQLGLEELRWVPAPAELLPFLNPAASALVQNSAGQTIGFCGELHPRAADAYGLPIDGAPVVFEVDVEGLANLPKAAGDRREKASRFPPSDRDLALLVDRGINFEEVRQAILEFPKRKHLTSAKLFDLFEGESLPAGKKSLAFRLQFRSESETLKSEVVDKEFAKCVSFLSDRIGAEQR